MISTRHKRQLCFYVTIAVVVFLIIYWGSSLAGRISWSSSSPTPEIPVDAEIVDQEM